MRNFQRKRVWGDLARSKPVLVFFGVLILFFAWSVMGLWGKMGETAENKKLAEEKVSALREQKEKLSAEISSLETEDGKEKFIRENLGLAKEGEGLIVIVEDKDAPREGEEEPRSGILNFFRNLFR